MKMTRKDCINWCAEKNYPRPPRSACIGCPFKSQDEWRALKEMPVEWKDAVEFDHALRNDPHIIKRFRGQAFLHRDCKPLDEVDLRTDDQLGIQSLFDMECEGMCGL
jgi:hypothetical protein